MQSIEETEQGNHYSTEAEERLVTEARSSERCQQKQGSPRAIKTAGSTVRSVVPLLAHTEELAWAFNTRKK